MKYNYKVAVTYSVFSYKNVATGEGNSIVNVYGHSYNTLCIECQAVLNNTHELKSKAYHVVITSLTILQEKRKILKFRRRK